MANWPSNLEKKTDLTFCCHLRLFIILDLCTPWLTEGLTDEWRSVDILVAYLNKQGLWPELAAYNYLFNWVFNWVLLTGKRCCLVLRVMVMGKCHHGGVGMAKGNRLGRYWDSVVSVILIRNNKVLKK